jgi:hypothetical protein
VVYTSHGLDLSGSIAAEQAGYHASDDLDLLSVNSNILKRE